MRVHAKPLTHQGGRAVPLVLVLKISEKVRRTVCQQAIYFLVDFVDRSAYSLNMLSDIQSQDQREVIKTSVECPNCGIDLPKGALECAGASE